MAEDVMRQARLTATTGRVTTASHRCTTHDHGRRSPNVQPSARGDRRLGLGCTRQPCAGGRRRNGEKLVTLTRPAHR